MKNFANMKYDYSSEKVTIIPKQIACLSTGDACEENSEIRRLRQKVIFFLTIELIIMTIYFIVQIISLILHDLRISKIYTGILIESFITLISIAYLIAFLIVITQYFPFAIATFIWLTLIQLIGGSILLPLAIMTSVASLSIIKSVGTGIIVDGIFIITGISIIVLSVLVILYLLNIMKLMKK